MRRITEIVLATGNKHKVDELKAVFPKNIQLKGLNDIRCPSDLPETQLTLEGNATQKATFVWDNFRCNCIADDTGLEIEALENRPGVFSARYAGEGKLANDNIQKVLRELQGIKNRKARFRTAIALLIEGEVTLFEGIINGTIAEAPKGGNGFGYDPIFIPEGHTKTFAELSLDEKNTISHRAIAVKKVIRFLAQLNKIKVGIIFGGSSREREISFAGGRTVYDNLNKSIFEPVPIFVDSFENFVELDWQYIYKGSIRDFYPPIEFLPQDNGPFQVYAENLGEKMLDPKQQLACIEKIGKPLSLEALKSKVEMAFLCLHGSNGEDGRIQGLLEWAKIPYTGSGIYSSALGMNKVIQKQLLLALGFKTPPFAISNRHQLNQPEYLFDLFEKVKHDIGFPLVIKPANQGSSIGVSVLKDPHFETFKMAMRKAYFTIELKGRDWLSWGTFEKEKYLKHLADIRESIGFPLQIEEIICYHPQEALTLISTLAQSKSDLVISGIMNENQVLIEKFIDGKEFSCIVIKDESGKMIALPPTEIRKSTQFYDYKSKYLPGLSRKITPIDLPNQQIVKIRQQCEKLMANLQFEVYARIDGFINDQEEVFLNDPNTTSGMMPSSFFFHQAAEIGLNPSQFLTFIIRSSMAQRAINWNNGLGIQSLLADLDHAIAMDHESKNVKKNVAVILGGYSSERHISVESGRNVYEKLSSSEEYHPFPVFLTGDDENHQLYHIPIDILLKDNADDIKEKITHPGKHPITKAIQEECKAITTKYAGKNTLLAPVHMTYKQLADKVDFVFIALHGRPGEDGAIQMQLENLNIPYNGSGVNSSKLTIDKFQTNELLSKNGFLTAKHCLVSKLDWEDQGEKTIQQVESNFSYPFIAKPVDDGCSSAVRKIKSREDLKAFAELIFRSTVALNNVASRQLNVAINEEFPIKNVFLIEELISKRDAKHFLEITGGILTQYSAAGELIYHAFEASETLVEGEILSLEEKFLAGQGQNITPARYSVNVDERQYISEQVKSTFTSAAKVLNILGYARIDAFVRIYEDKKVEVIFIEVNSLPGMTPATCIFHQSAYFGLKPFEFIDKILEFAQQHKHKVLSHEKVA